VVELQGERNYNRQVGPVLKLRQFIVNNPAKELLTITSMTFVRNKTDH
jgi:hypothetical protein